MKKQSPPNEKELALRKWCIDCAIRWPWAASIGYQTPMAQLQQAYRPAEAPDIINRANTIYNWIKR